VLFKLSKKLKISEKNVIRKTVRNLSGKGKGRVLRQRSDTVREVDRILPGEGLRKCWNPWRDD